jgi:hypothetical protein
LNTTLSALTGHIALRLPDGTLEDLTPQSASNAASTAQAYANGLYRLQTSGDTAELYDLTLNQQMHCMRQN